MIIVEPAINRYLALDPEALEKLSAFDGKVIKLEITGPKVTGFSKGHAGRELFLFPGKKGLQVSDEHDGAVDTVLSGSPLALFRMGVTDNTADLLLKGEVEISGDTRLGHQFKKVFSQMDIDWAELLSKWLGDELAWQATEAGKRLGQWGKAAIKSFAASTSEYLQEESRDVVTETELEIFNSTVDELREGVDRLEARLKALAQRGEEG
jgi:ubiquinone biosynthesis protein UbiJ